MISNSILQIKALLHHLSGFAIAPDMSATRPHHKGIYCHKHPLYSLKGRYKLTQAVDR